MEMARRVESQQLSAINTAAVDRAGKPERQS